jgi:hypothetical protein
MNQLVPIDSPNAFKARGCRQRAHLNALLRIHPQHGVTT